MGKKKEKEELKLVDAEFKVSMYCNACERSVARIISKMKGVEKFTTDMNKHRVVVTGRIDPQKILKKLRKKTGKKVEIVVKNKEETSPKDAVDGGKAGAGDPTSALFYCCKESEALTLMFNDENPNACWIM